MACQTFEIGRWYRMQPQFMFCAMCTAHHGLGGYCGCVFKIVAKRTVNLSGPWDQWITNACPHTVWESDVGVCEELTDEEGAMYEMSRNV